MKNFLILMILISGLIFTSIIKNKTRLLEKELLYLESEINILNSNLVEATLDFEYLTTPKNISLLATNYLEEEFTHYNRSQIFRLGEKIVELEEKLNKKNIVLSQFPIEKNVTNLKKPIIENNFNQLITKRSDTKNVYSLKKIDIEENSKSENILKSKKVQRWVGIQVLKTIFGIPILPIK